MSSKITVRGFNEKSKELKLKVVFISIMTQRVFGVCVRGRDSSDVNWKVMLAVVWTKVHSFKEIMKML